MLAAGNLNPISIPTTPALLPSAPYTAHRGRARIREVGGEAACLCSREHADDARTGLAAPERRAGAEALVADCRMRQARGRLLVARPPAAGPPCPPCPRARVRRAAM